MVKKLNIDFVEIQMKMGNPQRSSYVRYDKDMENAQRVDGGGS
jgi:hypothetical protein